MSPRVAIVPWGDVFEDWLDPLGVTPERFRDELTGSWMFGYADALRTAGVQTTIVCVTSRVNGGAAWTHRPTGASLRLLPPAAAYGPASRWMLRERVAGRRDPATLARAAARHLAPYLATPVLRLARVVREEGCDAVLCQEYETPRFDACVLAGLVARTPVFACFQGGDYQDSRLERPLRPLTLRRADRLIVATSSEIARVHERYGFPASRIAQIFNPVDTSLWRPDRRAAGRARLGVREDAVLVLWHGQMQMWRKGLDLLLQAWDEIQRARPGRDLRLVLVGRGADAAEVRARAAALAGVAVLDAWVDDRVELAELVAAGDVYVFPSRHEGFPVAPIEAMACGLPVVASDVHGVPDILAGGPEHGGLVVRRDDGAALAAALGALLDDPARRIELGRRARARAESAFAVDAVGAQLRRVLLREAA